MPVTISSLIVYINNVQILLHLADVSVTPRLIIFKLGHKLRQIFFPSLHGKDLLVGTSSALKGFYIFSVSYAACAEALQFYRKFLK